MGLVSDELHGLQLAGIGEQAAAFHDAMVMLSKLLALYNMPPVDAYATPDSDENRNKDLLDLHAVRMLAEWKIKTGAK